MFPLHIALALCLMNVGVVDTGGTESSGCSASHHRRCIFPKTQPVKTITKQRTPPEEFAAPERDVKQHGGAEAQKTNPSFAPKADLWQVASIRRKFDAKRVRRDLESAAGDEVSQTPPTMSRGRPIETSIASVSRGSVVLSTVHTPSTVFAEGRSSTFGSTEVKDASGESSQISTYITQSEKTTPALATANRSSDLSVSSDNDIRTAISPPTSGRASPTSSSLHTDDGSTPTSKAPFAFPNQGRVGLLQPLTGGLLGRAPVGKTAKISSGRKIASSDYDEVANLSCSGSLSCKNRCQAERNPGQTDDVSIHCYCDPFCSFFQDCCADYGEHCILNYTVPKERWTMQHPRGSLLDTTYYGVWAISGCPSNWSMKDVHKNCCPSPLIPRPPDYRESVPVASGNGATFCNRFCAECNGVPRQNLTFYELDESCFNNTEEERRCPNYDGRVHCHPLLWKPANGTHRRYFLRLVTRCLPGFSVAYRRECERTREYNIVSGIDATGVMVNYKNRFCALCHGAKSVRCGPVRIAGERVNANVSETPDLFLKAVVPLPSPAQCSPGKVYDPRSRACREGATKQPSAPSLRRYRVVLHVSPSISLPPNNPTREIEHPIKNALTSFLGIPPYHLANVLAITSADSGNKTIVAFDLDWPHRREEQRQILNFDAILNFTKPFLVEIDNQTHVVSNSSARMLACAQYEEFTAEEYTVLRRVEPVVYLNESREEFYKHQYYSVESTWKNCQEQPAGGISVCRLYLTGDCQGLQVPLKSSEYTVLPDGGIYRHDSHETFEFETYDSRRGTIWICTNFRPQSETLNRGYLIVLYVGLSVSVLCLLGTLVVHGLFADLRTSSGLDTVNISASLLLQQSLYFITWHVDSVAACSIAASLVHYFTLVSFSWLIVITWRTTTAASVLRTGQQDADHFPTVGHVVCSVASTWLLPIVFMVTSVALAFSGIFPSAVGFGVPKACLLSSASVNIILLYVPIAMSLAIAVSLLITTASKRRKSRAQTQDALVQEATSALPEVAGLAVLMGATWICAFLGMVVSEKLVFPFMALSSLHGVYIAVAFTLKRKLSELCGRVRCCADGGPRPNVQLKSIRPLPPVSPHPLDTRL